MPRIAYTMSRFPKVSETFVADEIAAVADRGFDVEILPLIHHHDDITHPQAAALEQRAHYIQPWSPAALGALAWWLVRAPGPTLRTVARLIRGNAGSRGFLLRSLALLPQAAWFARFCQRSGVEHVHAHFATHATTNAWVIHQLTGLPYTFTAHAHDIYVDTTFLDEKIRSSERAVAISEYGRGRMIACAPDLADRIVVIHLGVDLSLAEAVRTRVASEATADDDSSAGGTRQLLCVARLDATKGHTVLLDALERLRTDGHDVHLTLIGEGDLRADIESRIQELGLTDRVTMLGYRTHDEVLEAMARSDVVVAPSIETSSGDAEGIPVTLMEAMAIGTPVVATVTAGVPELITDGVGGVLVPQRDADALAAAVAGLLDDPGLADRLSDAAARAVAESFARDAVVDELVTLFAAT